MNAIEKATRQPITEMSLPSIDDVNSRRVARFADSITAGLSAPEVAFFRGLIEQYEQEHDVPLADIAAALAVIAQDGRSLLLEPEPEPVRAPRTANRDSHLDTPDRGLAPSRARKSRTDQRMASYRIGVGRRHKVKPAAIVGALANEGGLTRADFGHIDIRVDHSVVELPADLPDEVFARLRRTRISGQLIDFRRDTSVPAGHPKGRARPHRKG
jgi:ATP-dependent RNA helicase DeaD